jgi:hypothetical protein
MISQHAYQGHAALLRARGKRPRCRCAAEKRDELAPSQTIDPHVPPRFEDRTASYPKWLIEVRGFEASFAVRRETHGMAAIGTQETISPAAGGSAY